MKNNIKKTPDNHCLSGYPASKNVVEATGLEPTASASRTQRSTKLSHASMQRCYSIKTGTLCQAFFLIFATFAKFSLLVTA